MLTPGDLITFNTSIVMYQESDIKPERQFFLLLNVVSKKDLRLGIGGAPQSIHGEQLGLKMFLPRLFLQVLYHGRPIWVEVNQICVLKLV